ncbi:histidine kinase [Lentzea sp. NPDC005914]|uniref:sensor histidine kinase n=1 Tax=Lentzea sp. NPDC005914 TaxID=3154572 RepID=UPI0033F00279
MSKRWLDWAIAAGVAASLVVAGHPTSAAGYALLAASGLALVARRRAPIAVLATTGLTALGYQALGIDVPVIAFLFAVYSTMRAGHRVVTVAGSVLMLAALPLAALISPRDLTTAEAFAQSRDVLQIAWLIAAAAAGEALRQAERRADEAERTREETALRRANEERLHIARELHDSLTHQISVIKLQAEVAVHLAQKRGEEVPEPLLAIRDAGREASRELRATLEALRHDQDALHGIDDVPDLVQRARSAGLDAELSIEGERNAVPAAVERTAYRIVQESLTNIARHAAAATAKISIDYRPDALVIRVDDDGRANPAVAPNPGVGLLGMRERVTALGGKLDAAPRSEGGFTVQAELPVAQP